MDKPGFRLYEKTRYEGSYTGTDECSAFQHSASVEDSDWNFDLNYIVWLGQKKKKKKSYKRSRYKSNQPPLMMDKHLESSHNHPTARFSARAAEIKSKTRKANRDVTKTHTFGRNYKVLPH